MKSADVSGRGLHGAARAGSACVLMDNSSPCSRRSRTSCPQEHRARLGTPRSGLINPSEREKPRVRRAATAPSPLLLPLPVGVHTQEQSRRGARPAARRANPSRASRPPPGRVCPRGRDRTAARSEPPAEARGPTALWSGAPPRPAAACHRAGPAPRFRYDTRPATPHATAPRRRAQTRFAFSGGLIGEMCGGRRSSQGWVNGPDRDSSARCSPSETSGRGHEEGETRVRIESAPFGGI